MPTIKIRKEKLLKIKKLLRDNAEEIQKLATIHHAKLLGSSPTHKNQAEKYRQAHVKIIKAYAFYLDDFKKGTVVFKKLGEKLAKEAVQDGLTIEEAVDGTAFQKQAIWAKLKESGLLKEMSAYGLFEFSQIIESYCDVIASKLAFNYHNFFTEKFAQSNERFRALIEQSADAIALVNAKGKVLYASPTTKLLMGYTPEEFKKLTNPFALVPPNDRELVTKLFAKLLKKPGSTEHIVYRVMHKNGKHIWIESAMTNLIHDPNVGAVVLNYHDISERMLLESQKDDFISIATHELKTPVTSIKAYAQVLQSRFEKEGNTEAVRMLSKMDLQLNKLTNLIRDLLDATKVAAGKLQFHEGSFDLTELVKDIVDEMQMTTTKHLITKKLAPTKIISGDRDRIGQVITNLLSNAIKYSPNSKKIFVSTQTGKNEVQLRVQDFGIGVPKKKLKRVFDRFFRVGDAEDTFGGLGLGLFISSEIVKRHGGRIWVDSVEGEGSIFRVALPIEHDDTKKYLTRATAEDIIEERENPAHD